MAYYGGMLEMKIKEFIKKLQEFNQEAEVLVSSDEELNTIFNDVEVTYLTDRTSIIIWGNSGSELE